MYVYHHQPRPSAPRKSTHQNPAHHRHLYKDGHYMEQHAGQQEADALRSAINRPSETSRLPREMKVQVQTQQVVKDVAGNLPDRRLRNSRKDGVPQLLKKRGTNPREAVCYMSDSPWGSSRGRVRVTGNDYGPSGRPHRPAQRQKVHIHPVNNRLKKERNLHIQDLRSSSISPLPTLTTHSQYPPSRPPAAQSTIPPGV